MSESEVRLNEARIKLARVTKLVGVGYSTAAEVDAARAAVDSLEARIHAAREQVRVAERQMALERTNLDSTIIRAPFNGVVISKDAQPGEMVSPVSAGGGFTRTGIGTIVDMASLEIEVDVNESYINRVKPEQRVTAVLDAYPDWQIPGAGDHHHAGGRPAEGDRARPHRLHRAGSADPSRHGRQGDVPARRRGGRTGACARSTLVPKARHQDRRQAVVRVRRRRTIASIGGR